MKYMWLIIYMKVRSVSARLHHPESTLRFKQPPSSLDGILYIVAAIIRQSWPIFCHFTQ